MGGVSQSVSERESETSDTVREIHFILIFMKNMFLFVLSSNAEHFRLENDFSYDCFLLILLQ